VGSLLFRRWNERLGHIFQVSLACALGRVPENSYSLRSIPLLFSNFCHYPFPFTLAPLSTVAAASFPRPAFPLLSLHVGIQPLFPCSFSPEHLLTPRSFPYWGFHDPFCPVGLFSFLIRFSFFLKKYPLLPHTVRISFFPHNRELYEKSLGRLKSFL